MKKQLHLARVRCLGITCLISLLVTTVFFVRPVAATNVSSVGNPAGFGHMSNVQVLDADGRRAVQFWRGISTARSFTFKLFKLTDEQLVHEYLHSFDRRPNFWQSAVFDTGNLSLFKEWQIEKPPGRYGKDYEEVIIPADVPRGAYIMELVDGANVSQLLLVLSRNTLMLKSDASVTVWFNDINGAPITRGGIEIYDEGGEVIGADGRTRTACSQPSLRPRPNPSSSSADRAMT